jgi:hypothetical protein
VFVAQLSATLQHSPAHGKQRAVCPGAFPLQKHGGAMREKSTRSFRISNNLRLPSASKAASPDAQWSIPIFRADFPGFTRKNVEHSRHLPPSCVCGKWREYSNKLGSIIENQREDLAHQ